MVTGSASLGLQKAIRAVLIADTELQSLMGGAVRFFDYVPEREIMPYIYYQESLASSWDTTRTATSKGIGMTHEIDIYVYSSYEGSYECLSISDRIKSLLNLNYSITIDFHDVIFLQFSQIGMFKDEDKTNNIGQAYYAVNSFTSKTTSKL